MAFSILITSCGQINKTSPSSDGGNGSTGNNVGAGRAVIKNGGSVVAYIVDFVYPGVALVYIVSSDRYANIDLQTGQYKIGSAGGNTEFAFSGLNSTGIGVIDDDWAGPVGNMVFFVANKYWLVGSGTVTSFSYQSWCNGDGSCSNSSGSIMNPERYKPLTEITRPFNFEAIAPLTITYE